MILFTERHSPTPTASVIAEPRHPPCRGFCGPRTLTRIYDVPLEEDDPGSSQQEIITMKHVIVIAIATGAIAAPVWAADTAAQLNAAEVARIQAGAPAPMAPPPPPTASAEAPRCAPGLKWVPEGYRRGKWRSASCVRR